jgi:hypothetical protein
MRAVAGVGVKSIESSVIATRGDRLALIRARVADDERPDAFGIELLIVVGLNEDGRLVGGVLFDLDDIDAAYDELDRRYIAGMPTQLADTWNIIARAYAGMTRGELPPTSSDLVNVDHRRVAPMAPGNGIAYLRASWDLAPEFHLYIEAVHRLTELGAVFTRRSSGTSRTGFDAEWRAVDLITLEGGQINRGEIFEEEDLDAALTRFDEVAQPTNRLKNMARSVTERIRGSFISRDWDRVAEYLTGDFTLDDRRRTVNGGFSRGRQTIVHDLRTAADIGLTDLTEEFVALRGEHLILTRARYFGSDPQTEAFFVEVLHILEIDANQKVVAAVVFDPDDIDAAFEELEARYLVGEAAAHAHTWSVIANTYAALNRYELYPTTPGLVSIDHRRGASFAPGDLIAYVRAAWGQMPDLTFRIDAVHRLDDLGAVFTQVLRGTTQQGFAAEWRLAEIMTVEGDRINRAEIFDEVDIDAALAKFDELNTVSERLGNAATLGNDRVVDAFNRRDMDALAAAWAPNSRYDDRRQGLRDAGRMDREYARELMRDTPPAWRMETDVVGIRGRYLALVRQTWRDTSDPDLPVAVELLAVLGATDDELLCHGVFFDPEDIGTAFAELDARWIASGECVHPEIIKALRTLSDSANRHEWDALAARYSGATYTNHRQLRSGAETVADDMSSLRMLTSLVPDLRFEVTEVLELSAGGTVIHTVARGTSTEDVPIEIPLVILMLIDGDRITHAETFDLHQRDQAISRFEELDSNAPPPENAIARVLERVVDAFDRRDPQRYLALFADDCTYEDRRKGLRDQGSIRPDYAQTVTFGADAGWQAEFETIAVRGEHLMLGRATFRDQSEAGSPVTVEALNIGSIDDDELISWFAVLDPDDIDAAFAELTARWIASGEVAHPEVIEAAHRSNEMYNRHDWDAIKANESGATYVNHRQLVSAEPETIEDHWRSIRALATLIPDLRTEPTEILAHSAKGVVADLVVKGRTPTGTVIEFPAITLILFDGTRVAHMEAFDVDQRGLALDRFDELNRPDSQRSAQ